MPELTNTFSWSRSRNNTFQECRRRYFYQYYGSWGGWEPDAPEETRRLYVLKQLSSRQQWAGRVVHDAVEMALRAIAEGYELPHEAFIQDVVERMRQAMRWLKARAITDLVVAGVMTDLCVESTVREAFEKGFRVFVAPDACASKDRALHNAALAVMARGFAYLAASGELSKAVRS